MTTDSELLRAAIDASGLSAVRFATDVLMRDARTVRRWLAEDSPMPHPVRAFLQRELGLTEEVLGEVK